MPHFEKFATTDSEPLLTIDVIIPARHEEKHLGACLTALLHQNYPAHLVNIWVVDNSDNDKTIKVAQQYQINVARSAVPNISKARNTGIKLGNAQLIGFIDAHCVPDADWLTNMTKVFRDAKIGGCQGDIRQIYDSALVKAIALNTTDDSQDYWWDYTLSGENSAFPCIGTGNSMFRREAVESVGLFDESLVSCEDVDLSWKILFLGYELAKAEGCSITHHTPHSLWSYIRKYFNHGRGGARLVHKFQLKKNRQLPRPPKTLRSVFITDFVYRIGYLSESLKLALSGTSTPQTYIHRAVDRRHRPAFDWTATQRLHLSETIIYWFSRPERAIIVHMTRNIRFTMDYSGCHFFRCLTNQLSRKEMIEVSCQHYGQSPETIAEDIDAFIAELIDEGIVRIENKREADGETTE